VIKAPAFHSPSTMRLRVALGGLRCAAQLAWRHTRVGARTLRAATVGAVSARGREEVRRIADALAITDGIEPSMPVIGVDQITNDGTPIRLFELEPRHGNITLLELIVLSRLVRERAPRSLFEIGTFDGRTTLNLAANAPDDAVVHTLDLPSNQPTAYALSAADYQFVNKPVSGSRIVATPYAERVKQLYGDSATFDFSPYRADFVFVDGSHAYEYVLNDSRRALQLAGDGPAVIVWHDYGVWDGVTRAIHELSTHDPRFANLRWVRGTSLVVHAASP